MTMAINSNELFKLALSKVNEHYANIYKIELTEEDQKIDPKEPIFLSINFLESKKKEPLGVTHLVKLEGTDWDEMSWDSIARTVDEIKDSIFKIIVIHLKSKETSLYINNKGIKFDFKDSHIAIDNQGNLIKILTCIFQNSFKNQIIPSSLFS